MPETHVEFLRVALPLFQANSLIAGVAAGGSFVSPGLDEHSDLDLIVVVTDGDLPFDKGRRVQIAQGLGDLIACFTGEHVGEPRLLICLYAPWLLHVDLKFTTLEGFRERVEDPAILYDPSGELARTVEKFPGSYPAPDLQWAEDRIWIWTHYAAQKLRRGELLTAKQSADYILQRIIGPLILQRAGAQPCQLRRIEQIDPPELADLRRVTSASTRPEIRAALRTVADLYIALRDSNAIDIDRNPRAQVASLRFVEES